MSQGLWHYQRRRVHPWHPSIGAVRRPGFVCVAGIPQGCVVPGPVLLGLGVMPTVHQGLFFKVQESWIWDVVQVPVTKLLHQGLVMNCKCEVRVPEDEHTAFFQCIDDCQSFVLDGGVAWFSLQHVPRTNQDQIPSILAAHGGGGDVKVCKTSAWARIQPLLAPISGQAGWFAYLKYGDTLAHLLSNLLAGSLKEDGQGIVPIPFMCNDPPTVGRLEPSALTEVLLW